MGGLLVLPLSVALAALAWQKVGDGRDPRVPVADGGDLGDRSDATALGQAVTDGLARGGHGRAGGASPNPPCANESRVNFGQGLGPLVYTAGLRWQGTPATALAYRAAAGPGPNHRLHVLARNGCTLLVTQSLSVPER